MALLLFRRFRILARRYRYVWLVRIGALARARRYVHYFARQNVRFRYLVLGFEVFTRFGGQALDLPFISGQLVCYRDVRDRQVAVVLHRDLIGDLLAQRILAVLGLRCARRLLFDRQVPILLFRRRSRSVRIVLVARRHRVFSLGCLRVLRILRIGYRIALRNRCIRYFACQDVRFRYYVFGLEDFFFAYTQLLDYFMQVGQFIIDSHVVIRYVAFVLDHDLILDRFAKLVGFAVCRCVHDLLVHTQRCVKVFRRLRIFARRYRYVGLVRVGALARARRYVHYFARQNVRFRYLVLGFEVFTRFGGQALDLPFISGQLVCYRDVRDRQVAVVLHRDLVGDLLAQRILAVLGLRRARRHLLDRQVAFLLFRRIFCRRRLVLRRLVARVRTCGRRFVLHAARQDVLLGHFVLERRSRHFLRLQFRLVKVRRDVFRLVARHRVRQLDVADRYVAYVRYLDLIRDRLAQFVRLPVLRLARRRLHRRQTRIRLFGRNFSLRRLLDVTHLCGYCVDELASQDIRFRNRIGSCSGNRLAARYVLENALIQRHAFDFTQGDGLSLVVDVCRGDCEGCGLAQSQISVLSRLVYDQFRINRLIRRRGAVRYDQRTVHVADLVTRCDVLTRCVHDLRFARYVRAFTNQRLAAGDLHAVDLVAIHQFTVRQFVLVVRQSFTVVDLLV